MNSTDLLLAAIADVKEIACKDGTPFAARHQAHLALDEMAKIYRNRVEAHSVNEAEETKY